jgi:hypothetical protein
MKGNAQVNFLRLPRACVVGKVPLFGSSFPDSLVSSASQLIARPREIIEPFFRELSLLPIGRQFTVTVGWGNLTLFNEGDGT